MEEYQDLMLQQIFQYYVPKHCNIRVIDYIYSSELYVELGSGYFIMEFIKSMHIPVYLGCKWCTLMLVHKCWENVNYCNQIKADEWKKVDRSFS